MSRFAVHSTVVAAFLVALTGCGQKGPLYLEEEETAELPAVQPAAPAGEESSAEDAPPQS